MSDLQPCGTYAAYRRHLRNGEPVDASCAQAARDQKNVRAAAALNESAEIVALAVAGAPAVDSVDELEEALENLRIVRAAMAEAPANSIAGLSKRREELVSRISKLQLAKVPKVGVLDQLAARRKERRAGSAY
jgi:hypothetical protein